LAATKSGDKIDAMSLLFPSPGPTPEVHEPKEHNILLWLLVATGVAVVLFAAMGVHFWQKYSAKYTEIDHASESFSVNILSSVATPNENGGTINFRSESIYKNSKSGVTLKLPGNWGLLSGKGVDKPDPAHRFCVLGTRSGLSAMFWPNYPEYLPSLSADATFIRRNSEANGIKLNKETEVLVGGREAVFLEFLLPDKKTSLKMLLVRKWPALYILAMSGPEDGGAWEEVLAGLPQSIEIK